LALTWSGSPILVFALLRLPCELKLVFLSISRKNLQAHGSTVVALHPEVCRVSYFPQGTEVNLLSSLSKDNTRIDLVEGREDSYGFRV
jgi:hypothetical protein